MVSRVGRRTMGLVLVAGLAAAVSAAADFKRDYDIGVRALENGDNREALERLEAAIADNAKAEEKVRFRSMIFMPYLPHFYLGQARFALGDCEGAISAWNESLNQGVIKATDQLPTLQANMKTCEARMVDVSNIAQAAESAIGAFASAADGLAAMESQSLLRDEWAAQWQPRVTEARQAIGNLRSRLQQATGARDSAAIEAIQAEARKGASALDGARDLAEARVAAIQEDQARRLAQDKEQANRELQQALASAKALPPAATGNERMQKLRGELDNLVTRGDSLGGSASALNQREVAQGINNALRRYQQAEQDWRVQQQTIADRTPPPLLLQVAQAYFQGDYAATARLAEPGVLDKSREKVQLHLFRAAANFKLYTLSGASDARLMQSIQDDIRQIKRLDRDFSPYLAAFSPSFVTLFRQTT